MPPARTREEMCLGGKPHSPIGRASLTVVRRPPGGRYSRCAVAGEVDATSGRHRDADLVAPIRLCLATRGVGAGKERLETPMDRPAGSCFWIWTRSNDPDQTPTEHSSNGYAQLVFGEASAGD